MKKIFALIVALLTIGVSAHAITISQQWDKTYNYGLDVALSSQQTFDGGYIVAGTTSQSFGQDIWIVKLDFNGNIFWQKCYGSDIGENGTSIRQTTDGGYIVGGATTYATGLIWVLKLDVMGDISWQKTYDGINDEGNTFIEQTSDGGYILSGTTTSFGAGGRDITVIKLDSSSNIIWQKAYGGGGNEGVGVAEFHIPIEETTDGGYIVACGTSSFGAGEEDFLVFKLDSNGNVIWEKTYGGDDFDGPLSVKETSDGGYIVAGATYSYGAGLDDFWVLKLDSLGSVIWQKTYGGDGFEFATSIQQTTDGQYIVAGGSNNDNNNRPYLWVLKLDVNGNISWKKTYIERISGFYPSIQQTFDGGYFVSSNYKVTDTSTWDFWVLKLASNGEIADCNVMATPDIVVSDTSITGQDCDLVVSETNFTVTTTNIEPENTSAIISELCYYEDPDDIDGDGISNNPGGAMSSSIYGGSFLADEDNCPDMPNGPYLGTCIAGDTFKIGRSCISDVECGTDGFCSMNQEDINGDGIGDACYLCECDFNCDGNVDVTDVINFLTDFGRSEHSNPCTNEEPCKGDFNCDRNVDSADVTKLLEDFGRSEFFNSCPPCEVGDWCVYP